MRVLSIDGGGIRGLIPAVVLAAVEERAGKRIHELFDLVAGTSTGSVVATALARPREDGTPMSAAELVEQYTELGPRIFDRTLLHRVESADGLLEEKYAADGLMEVLHLFLGDERLSDTLVALLLPAYAIEDRFAFFFRSSRAREDATYDFKLVDAVRASSAAPTYFEPALVTDVAGDRTYALVDGGVFANSPAGCALAELGEDGPQALTVLASVGTGSATEPIPYAHAKRWGMVGWARSVIDVLMSGQSEVVDYELRHGLGARYMRFQTRLDHASDAMDDATPENLRALRETGERLVRDRAGELDALVARLLT